VTVSGVCNSSAAIAKNATAIFDPFGETLILDALLPSPTLTIEIPETDFDSPSYCPIAKFQMRDYLGDLI